MPSFRQRMGLAPMEKQLQTTEIDADLRAQIWNVLHITLWNRWEPVPDAYSMHERSDAAKNVDHLVKMIWIHHFKRPIDTIPYRFNGSGESVYRTLREIVMDGDWDRVYDLVDFIVNHAEPPKDRDALARVMNQVLTNENSGFRFVGLELTQITAPAEIEAVESALQTASKAVRVHLAEALSKLSDRKNPDFRNSIKESISAVEAACRVVANKPNATLGQCLGAIQKVKPLHGAFVEALNRLYGYTSDADQGIRHAASDEATPVTKADAQFMLVACSAFINYLWSVAAEVGMKIE